MKKLLILLSLVLCSQVMTSQNFMWAQSAGATNGSAKGKSLATDAHGNIYTTGYFGVTTDFNFSSTLTNTLQSNGMNDLFITKHDSTGNLIWARGLGGTKNDQGNSIAIDASGNIYVTGFFYGLVDFDPDPVNAFMLSGTGNSDIFILKLNTNGNFVWANRIGGNFTESEGQSISLDKEKNVYVTGNFSGTGMDFNPGAAIDSLKGFGGWDAFLLKLDSLGNYLWAKNIGGTPNHEVGHAVTIDPSGNCLTTGYFSGYSDFNPGTGVNMLNCSGAPDTFILKLDKNGNYIWAKKTGGSGMEQGNDLITDAEKNIYITGYFESTSDFNPSISATYTLTAQSGGLNSYIVKLDSSGNFKFAKQVGGALANNISNSIFKDAFDNIYITGCFMNDTDFDPGIDTFEVTAPYLVGNDGYVLKLTSQGNFVNVLAFGRDSYSTFGEGVTIDKKNNIIVTGSFSGYNDFDPDPVNSFYLTGVGNEDMFLVKFGGTTVGLNELSMENSELSVFPNPGNGALTIQSKEDMKISLINELGQTIESFSLTHENNYRLSFNKLLSGVYFIVGQGNKQTVTRKVMVAN